MRESARPSTSSASRSPDTPRSRRRSPPPGTRSGSTGTGTRCSCVARPAAVRDDLDRAGAVIGEATGVQSLSYRPPYGVFSLAGLRLARERWAPLLWSHWGRDWEAKATGSSIAALATRDLGPGAVVLLHDSDAYSVTGSWRQTVAALPAVLDAALAAGEPLVTPSQST